MIVLAEQLMHQRWLPLPDPYNLPWRVHILGTGTPPVGTLPH